MKPKTYLFPGTVHNWRADVPITEKIVWKAVAEAAKHASAEHAPARQRAAWRREASMWTAPLG
jgi:hypothetical protein